MDYKEGKEALDKFKSLCIDLLNKNGLEDWEFEYYISPDYRAHGKCSYSAKTIYLDVFWTLCRPENEVESTIIHEIAHALCPKCKHNNTWRETSIKIGYSNFLANHYHNLWTKGLI